MELALLGGSWDKGKVSTPWEVPLLVGRSTEIEEELQGLGGEHSHRFAGGTVERDLRIPASHACPPCGKGLDGAALASGSYPERTGISCVQPEMWGEPQSRVHGKKSGTTREARHHGWGDVRWGHHHRRFFLCTL